MEKEFNETLELIIELIEGMAQEEGYKTLRMSESNNIKTTAYDALILKDANGQEYTITFDKSIIRERNSFQWHSTNYIKD